MTFPVPRSMNTLSLSLGFNKYFIHLSQSTVASIGRGGILVTNKILYKSNVQQFYQQTESWQCMHWLGFFLRFLKPEIHFSHA